MWEQEYQEFSKIMWYSNKEWVTMLILSENAFISPTILLRAYSLWDTILHVRNTVVYISQELCFQGFTFFWGNRQLYKIISDCNECAKHYNVQRRQSDKEVTM